VFQRQRLIVRILADSGMKKLIHSFHQAVSFLEKLGYQKIVFPDEVDKSNSYEKHCVYYHSEKHSYVKFLNISEV
jgi:hypothetical protein